MRTTSQFLAEHVGGEHHGPVNIVDGFWNAAEATETQATFWDRDWDRDEGWPSGGAGTVICRPWKVWRPPHLAVIYVPNPRRAAMEAAQYLHPDWDTIPWAQCIRNRTGIVSSGDWNSIGGPGHGYELVDDRWQRIPHIGKVIFGDNIQLGSGINIDRGTFSNTVIGDGTVIDSHVHIAHNCRIGRRNFIAAGANFSGSVTTGDDVWVGTGAVVMQGVTNGTGAVIGVGAVVLRDVAPGETVVGHHRVIPTKDKQPGVTR